MPPGHNYFKIHLQNNGQAMNRISFLIVNQMCSFYYFQTKRRSPRTSSVSQLSCIAEENFNSTQDSWNKWLSTGQIPADDINSEDDQDNATDEISDIPIRSLPSRAKGRRASIQVDSDYYRQCAAAATETKVTAPPPSSPEPAVVTNPRLRSRRPSFQVDSIITDRTHSVTTAQFLSEMKLQYSNPGPMRAIMRQYGSSTRLNSKENTEKMLYSSLQNLNSPKTKTGHEKLQDSCVNDENAPPNKTLHINNNVSGNRHLHVNSSSSDRLSRNKTNNSDRHLHGTSISSDRHLRETSISNDRHLHGTPTSNGRHLHGTSSNDRHLHGTSSNDRHLHGTSSNDRHLHGTSSNDRHLHGTSSNDRHLHGTSSNDRHLHGTSTSDEHVRNASNSDTYLRAPSGQLNICIEQFSNEHLQSGPNSNGQLRSEGSTSDYFGSVEAIDCLATSPCNTQQKAEIGAKKLSSSTADKQFETLFSGNSQDENLGRICPSDKGDDDEGISPGVETISPGVDSSVFDTVHDNPDSSSPPSINTNLQFSHRSIKTQIGAKRVLETAL